MATGLTLEQAAAILPAIASSVTIGRLCTLSAWVLLLWDYIIHFDKEVELFWLKPWSVAKGLYLFNRYGAIVFVGVHAMVFLNPHVTDTVCLFWFKFEGYTGWTGIAAVELILGFRVLALWNRNKWVILFVGVALLAELSTMLAILSSTYVHMGASAELDPKVPYRACLPFNIPPYFFAFWLPPLGYEFAVFVLASAKGYSTMRTAFKNFTFRSTGSRLLEVMIRDSLWYFLLIFLCDMTCALIWLKGPDALLQAVVGFGLVIPSIAAAHLLINLRDAYYHPTGETTIGRTDYERTGTGELPTFNRSDDIMASGGRHRVKGQQVDSMWDVDTQHDKSFPTGVQDPPGLPRIPGSTSTFHTRTLEFTDDIKPSELPILHSIHPSSSSTTNASELRRPSVPTEESQTTTFVTSRFVETSRHGHAVGVEHDAYEMDDVTVTVHPHTPPRNHAFSEGSLRARSPSSPTAI